MSSLLFSPSLYKYCFVICLQLPPHRLVYKLFAGGKVMELVIFQFSIKVVVVAVVVDVGKRGGTYSMTSFYWFNHN